MALPKQGVVVVPNLRLHDRSPRRQDDLRRSMIEPHEPALCSGDDGRDRQRDAEHGNVEVVVRDGGEELEIGTVEIPRGGETPIKEYGGREQAPAAACGSAGATRGATRVRSTRT